MNPTQQHALARDHRRTLRDAAPAWRERDLGRRPWADSRQRLGVLLVEAGLHLIATADRSPLPAALPR